MKYRKKLIEAALPLEAINTASARKKNMRHRHPKVNPHMGDKRGARLMQAKQSKGRGGELCPAQAKEATAL